MEDFAQVHRRAGPYIEENVESSGRTWRVHWEGKNLGGCKNAHTKEQQFGGLIREADAEATTAIRSYKGKAAAKSSGGDGAGAGSA